MKRVIIAAILAVTAFSFALKTPEKTTWTLDKAHSKLGFTITHLMVSDVEGRFGTFDVKVTSAKGDFSDPVAELTADVNSINTDNEQRDKHLRSPDFFDIAKYPVLTFKSKTFTKVNDNNYKVTGDLTMHGITKTIELDVVYKIGTNPMSKQTIAGFKISGTLKRSDFGIAASMSSVLLSDEVSMVINMEFIKSTL
jgi:polyisoprenoid-binding protein YceI